MGSRVVSADFLSVVRTPGGRRFGEVDRDVLAAPAVFAAATLFCVRIAINAGVVVPVDLVVLQEWLVPLSAVGCAGSLLAIAVLDSDGYETIGLAFVGVFGVVGTAARPAYAPVVVAITVGTALATGSRLRTGDELRLGPIFVTGLLIGGLAVSLAGTFGIEPTTTRTLGTQLTLLGIAGTPAFLARGRADWLLGALGAGLLVALGVIAPFLLGATGLVAGGIVGASVPVMALSVGGLTMTASAALRSRHHAVALGAGLLLFAGIPATIPRALALALAVTLLVESSSGGEEHA